MMEGIKPTRRGFLLSLGAILSLPAIVKVPSAFIVNPASPQPIIALDPAKLSGSKIWINGRFIVPEEVLEMNLRQNYGIVQLIERKIEIERWKFETAFAKWVEKDGPMPMAPELPYERQTHFGVPTEWFDKDLHIIW